ILRTHAQATAEPYNYPDQQHIILPLIKERYRWLPYNYTLAYENASQGLPLVRPLNFYSPGSDRFDDITDEYLWGRDILVAPVMTQGATRRTIVLPDGLWVDYNNPGRLYNGGDTVTYPAPLEVLPLFVRAGAIIPQADYGMQSTEDYRTDRYTINYYPYLGKSEYTLFEDDRKSPGSLDEGAYSLINFTGEASIEGINLDISSQGTYPGAPKVKDLTFRIHLVDGDPSSVSVDGHKLKRGAWKFDRSESMLTFKIKWNVDKPLAIHIR
ncbi:glycoside hydrolase family 31 protein, partial [Duncaniella muris]